MTETIAEQCGVRHKLVSIRMVDMPVLEVLHQGARLEAALLTQSRLAIDTDHADAIVLGCTGMFGMAERLAVALGGDIPVIDPILAAFKMAEFLGGLRRQFGWTPSRAWSCAPPPEAELAGFGIFSAAPPIGNRVSY